MRSFLLKNNAGLARWEWLVLVAALAVRWGYAWHLYSEGKMQPAMDEYETIARNLVDHGRYDGFLDRALPTAAREPAFPFLIAAVYWLFGKQPVMVLAVLGLLNIATCLLLRHSARTQFGELAGRTAFVLAAFYPYFIFYAAHFYRETLLTFVVALLLVAVGRALARPTAAAAAGLGLVCGLLTVSLSTFLPIMALGAIWLTWRLYRAQASPRALAAFAAALALLPSLWIGRNFAVFGRFIPGSTLGGFNLYTALIVPEEWRGTDREWDYEMADPHWGRIMKMSPLMGDDGSQQEAFFAVAVEHIKANPGHYAKHVLWQAGKLWRFYPYNRQYVHDYGLIKLVSLLSDGWIIPLGFFGLWRLRRGRPQLQFAILMILSGTLTYALLSAIMRYRMPFMPPLLVAASAVVARRIEETRT